MWTSCSRNGANLDSCPSSYSFNKTSNNSHMGLLSPPSLSSSCSTVDTMMADDGISIRISDMSIPSSTKNSPSLRVRCGCKKNPGCFNNQAKTELSIASEVLSPLVCWCETGGVEDGDSNSNLE